jgi:uncharacterized protein
VRALFDVNVLLALFDQDHRQSQRAHNWRTEHRDFGWASCPLSENGFVRIISQPAYPHPRSAAEAASVLLAQKRVVGHEFWSDDMSIADIDVFDHTRILGPNQITDIYLLALAVKHDGRLVTFDRGIPLSAVRRAEARHIVVI